MSYSGWVQNPPGGGGDLILVETITVGVATGLILFDDLDGNVDGYYEIVGQVEFVNSPDRILIKPDGFTSNMTTQLLFSGGGGALQNLSNDRLTIAQQIIRPVMFFHARLYAGLGDESRGLLAHAVAGTGPVTQLDTYLAQGSWNNESSNITDLEIQAADNANGDVTGFQTGSQFTLWKRPF